jgi:hypothetical protein
VNRGRINAPALLAAVCLTVVVLAMAAAWVTLVVAVVHSVNGTP